MKPLLPPSSPARSSPPLVIPCPSHFSSRPLPPPHTTPVSVHLLQLPAVHKEPEAGGRASVVNLTESRVTWEESLNQDLSR